MTNVPIMKDWKGNLEKEIEVATNKKGDMAKIIRLGEEYLKEIKPAVNWVNINHSFVMRITQQFAQIYETRFGEAPPAGNKNVTISQNIIGEGNTKEGRRELVKKIALEIAVPGSEISDKEILAEIKRRNIEFVASNPSAAVSTILFGFKDEFEKIQGRRGVYKRRVQ